MYQVSKTAGAPLPADPDERAMQAINALAIQPLTPETVYRFSVRACDDQVDRDGERFTADCLRALAPMYIGKTIIMDHSWSATNQIARVYNAEVVQDGAVTYLRADAYLPRTESTQPIIDKLAAGILREVSVGCSVNRATCSICGLPYGSCDHRRGERYGESLCVVELSEPTDAYEISFVVVPAQPAAGVIKAASNRKPMSTHALDACKRAIEIEKIRFTEVINV